MSGDFWINLMLAHAFIYAIIGLWIDSTGLLPVAFVAFVMYEVMRAIEKKRATARRPT